MGLLLDSEVLSFATNSFFNVQWKRIPIFEMNFYSVGCPKKLSFGKYQNLWSNNHSEVLRGEMGVHTSVDTLGTCARHLHMA